MRNDGRRDSARGAQSTGTARAAAGRHAASAEVVRDALLQKPDGELPEVTFDVDRYDASGRELEWSWNFNGGLWHPYDARRARS